MLNLRASFYFVEITNKLFYPIELKFSCFNTILINDSPRKFCRTFN
jgi:hypothetical protein